MWQRDTTGECSDEDEDSATITDTSYDITGLEEDSSYSITVRASNTAGSSEDSNPVTAMTLEAGERDIATDIGHAPNPLAVPSDSPTSITVSRSTSTTITVQWGEVECIDRNGEIAGYSVRYSGGGSTDTRFVSGGDTRQATISELIPFTEYTIEVAPVNNEGTGPYSVSIIRVTQGANVSFYVVPLLGLDLYW